MTAGQPRHIFRAIWPITDESLPFLTLTKQASEELNELAARAHATRVSRGRWYVADSVYVPGSGRTTKSVLVYEAAAVPATARNYWRSAS